MHGLIVLLHASLQLFVQALLQRLGMRHDAFGICVLILEVADDLGVFPVLQPVVVVDAHSAVLLIFGEQQAGDEEPAQHEEQIDRDPADLVPKRGRRLDRWGDCGRGQLYVTPEDEDDGDAAEHVQLRHPRHFTASTRRGR